MKTTDIHTKVNLDATRLELFLRNNQLVQAHGVAHTIDKMMQDAIDQDCAELKIRADQHRWFPAFKAIIRAEPKILQGDSQGALAEAQELLKVLAQIQDFKEPAK